MRNKVMMLLCCALLCLSARAAGLGLTVTLTDGEDAPRAGVELGVLAVTGPEGRLTEELEGCGLSPERLLEDNAENAKTLLDYMEEAGVKGKVQETDKRGRAAWSAMPKGIYLVYCPAGQEAAMLPFLVELTGKDVEARPKVEEPGRPIRPDSPDVPDTPDVPEPPADPDIPVDPEKPIIPQTGVNVWPMYLLGGAGLVLMAAGANEVRRGRRDHE